MAKNEDRDEQQIKAPVEITSNGNVSSDVIKLLNEQLAHEAYNSRLYLKIAAYLTNLGLNNIGAHFYGQFDEENTHQRKVVDYLTDRNERVLCLHVPEVEYEPISLTAIAEAYLKQEQSTTALLKNIAKVSMSEGDFLTFKWAQDMLEIQRAEESEAIDFKDKMDMAGDNLKTLVILDKEFGG